MMRLQRRQRQHVRDDRLVGLVADREHEAILDEAEVELVGAVVAAIEREGVAFEDVEDRDLALVLDVGVRRGRSTSHRA